MSVEPTPPRVKICGIDSEASLSTAVAAGADAIGVITDLPVDSPREVPIELARELVARTPPFVTSVLVTMVPDAASARGLLDTVGPDVLQLHGSIPPDEVADIATETRVIRAIDVDDREAIHALSDDVDAILLDSSDEYGAGGTGRTHDWDLAREHVRSLDVPVVLAGGLTPENVARAVAAVHPYAVDVASGVEGNDGKDPAAVARFISRAKMGGR